MIKEKRYSALYRTFFPLLLVIAVQGVVTLGVNLADNFMLGGYSEAALSGAALVNQIQFILQSLIGGIGAGIAALCSQYWGREEIDPIKRIISLGLKFAFLGGLIFWAVTFFFPENVLRLLTNDEPIIAEGVKYLRVMCWTYLVFSVSSALVYSLQSVQTAWIGSVMAVATLCINTALNYVLIFGHFGAPRLGITGAAIATLTSRCVELLIILAYVLFGDKKLRLRLRELLRFDFSYLKDFLRVSMPMVASGANWGIAQAAQTAILGRISGETIAANAIASVIFSIFTVFGFSCCNAAQVTIGKTVGMGEHELVKSYAKRLQLIFIAVGVVTGALIFTFRGGIVGLFSEISGDTRALALQFLIVLSVATVGTCYEYPVESGIIAGGGNTKYAAIVDFLFMWLFTIPTAAVSALVLHWPPVVTFCFLKADQLLKCVPNAIVVNRFKWIRQLTRSGAEVNNNE
jgi:putative MATE family efflux protein